MALSVSSFASSSCRNFPATNTTAAVGLRSDLPKIHTPISRCKTNPTFRVSFLPVRVTRKPPRKSLQVRSVAAPSEAVAGFDEMDLTGGMLVPVEGPDSPLFALEINPEKAREEFRNASQKNGGTGVKDFMDGMGLGMLVEQLGELKLGELLDTPPPGLDEAIAISKASIVRLAFVISLVMQFLESQEYSIFTRIVFDTAPTGHTLRLLSLPDFLDASIGKILKADKLERLRERMVKVRELFRDTDSTRICHSNNPYGKNHYKNVMAISESSRLHASLKRENVPVKKLIVNQVLPPSTSDCKFCAMKRKDQMRALDMIKDDPELSNLTLIQAPLVDVEIRGVPALQFMGDIVWK
ncbi:putative arsenical pump-driving ATPase [Vitis vinifera]|uniref:Putative arsenical pump-driving ATPase n=1 Tax=Vitis vinifera TaxID=29760 RepID=A0A438CWE7_VITVI|nr:putative arsenical pump-driving ATPase [Vitis vinifera]